MTKGAERGAGRPRDQVTRFFGWMLFPVGVCMGGTNAV